MTIRIEAPHFVASYDLHRGLIDPAIRWMRGWSLDHIKQYCLVKGWRYEVTP